MFTSWMVGDRQRTTSGDLPAEQSCSSFRSQFQPKQESRREKSRARLLQLRAGLALTKVGGNARKQTLHGLLKISAVPRQVLLFIRPFPINHRQTPPAPSDRPHCNLSPWGRLDSISNPEAVPWPLGGSLEAVYLWWFLKFFQRRAQIKAGVITRPTVLLGLRD